jgi:hypothetical protein
MRNQAKRPRSASPHTPPTTPPTMAPTGGVDDCCAFAKPEVVGDAGCVAEEESEMEEDAVAEEALDTGVDEAALMLADVLF